MSKTIITTLALALASSIFAGERKPDCCQVVERTVYENPKPKYPKDPRQYIVVKRKVSFLLCAQTERLCLKQTPKKAKAKEPTCRC